MSSQRRIDFSRANCAKSHGPVTPDGLARSSRNSLKHGCYAQSVVLANESQDRFNDLLDSYTQILNPQNELQMDWVEEMAVAKWRQRRIWAMETTLLDIQMALDEKEINENFGGATEEMRSALAYKKLCNESGTLATLHRYEARSRRAHDCAYSRLMQIDRNETNLIPFPNTLPATNMPLPDATQIQSNPPFPDTEAPPQIDRPLQNQVSWLFSSYLQAI
jgi:hypothetical protein